MVADHHLCWRLRGVPSNWDTDDVIDYLGTNILDQRSETVVTVKSLALDPTCNRPWKTATLNFEKIPKKLQGRVSGRVQSENGVRDVELDNHFFGFTPLHRIPDESCDIEWVDPSTMLTTLIFAAYSPLVVSEATPLALSSVNIAANVGSETSFRTTLNEQGYSSMATIPSRLRRRPSSISEEPSRTSSRPCERIQNRGPGFLSAIALVVSLPKK